MTEMIRRQLKYLPVLDHGEVVGMVSLHDLMRYRSHKAMLLLGSIREERSLAGLAATRRELVTVAQTLLAEMRSSPEMTEILSHIHHGIIRRTFELCLGEAAAQGRQPPPVRYCLLLLGSAGRREMLLAPDQDHALLFEDYPAEQHAQVEAFFTPLTRRLVAALAEVGYPRCDGLVMADQPQWRGRLSDWRERVRDWVANPEPQQVRNSSIFFDFAAVSGDPALAQELRELVLEEVTGQPGFLYQMMALELRYKVPVGLLGRFVVERGGEHRGELSLKLGGTLYIVDCVRTFALEKGVREVNTWARLKALVAADIFAAETAEHIRAAFEALTFLRLRHEIRQIGSGSTPGHHLDPHSLSKTEQELLREAFQAVGKLQDATKRYFSRNPF
jgi:CBS domain-containing protein